MIINSCSKHSSVRRDQSSCHGEMDEDGKESAGGEELFQIIDETGEGWGFDLTPETVTKPLATVTAGLFGLGMLAGIPAGLAVARNQVGKEGGKKVKPSMAGFLFASGAFMTGTMLCGAMGAAGMYGLKWYYEVETFEEFGIAMRDAVPKRRREVEAGLGPLISRIRLSASDSLPGPLDRLREKFRQSKTGVWMRSHFELEPSIDAEGSEKSDGNRNDLT